MSKSVNPLTGHSFNWIDLTGQRFGRLVVVCAGPIGRGNRQLWNCVCDCGGHIQTSSDNLRKSHTKSCGCLQPEVARSHLNRLATRHGEPRHGMHGSKTYASWLAMLQRCFSPSGQQSTKDYKGIVVCDRWRKFQNFFADMGLRPQGKSLDRYPNPIGNYEPSNCRWATNREQALNKRPRIILEFVPVIDSGIRGVELRIGFKGTQGRVQFLLFTQWNDSSGLKTERLWHALLNEGSDIAWRELEKYYVDIFCLRRGLADEADRRMS